MNKVLSLFSDIVRLELMRKLFFILIFGMLIPLMTVDLVRISAPRFTIAALILSVAVTLACILFYLKKNISSPLCDMGDKAEKLASGSLCETMPEDVWMELNKISSNINEFSVNQQELLLHFWNHSSDTIIEIDSITSELKSSGSTDLEALEERLTRLLENLKQSHSLLGKFRYYDVHITHGRMLASNDSDPRRS